MHTKDWKVKAIKRLEGQCNHSELEPHRSREQVNILKELWTFKAALAFMSVKNKREASAAAMQCLAEFGLLP